jgi:hypothetical protein
MTMPRVHQGPMARACARQLNYQVKSFLVVHTNPSQNWMLFNSGNECLILGTWDMKRGEAAKTTKNISKLYVWR